MSKLIVMNMNRIAGGARNRSYNIAFATNQRINKRRFAHVGTADNSIFWKLVIIFRFIFKMLNHFIKQFSCTRAGHG